MCKMKYNQAIKIPWHDDFDVNIVITLSITTGSFDAFTLQPYAGM